MLAYLQKGGQMVLNLLRPKKKLGWISFVFLGVALLAMVLVTTPIAHAGIWETVAEAISKVCLMAATLFMKLTIFLLSFIIELAAYNGYLDSSAVNYGWVMVRDITNMGFVVILLVIAFGTILGLEQYEWKKLMVKFVLAAILVNFSRVICGVIIDVGQVVMVTFINGVAATAGGNLIKMFNMDSIMSLTSNTNGENVNASEVLMASAAAVGFSAMMLGTMFVFLVMLMGRMLTLWVLIVLSPLAFVLSVIPQTQKYASEWWQNFGNNVISGPVIAFFLWLSFVTVGGGNINSEVSGASQTDLKVTGEEADKVGTGEQSAGLTSAMSWDKMANFAIAIGMLLVGAKTAQSLGVAGGSMMSKATDFAKKAATIATGVAAGQWAAKGAKKAGKWTAMNMPGIGGNAWKRRGLWAQDKALQAGEKWNQVVGAKAGAWAQFGSHEKIMRERKAIVETRKGNLSSSVKGYRGWHNEKPGGIEEMRAYSDRIAGVQAVNKERSEATRSSRKSAAGREFLETNEEGRQKYAKGVLAQKTEATRLDSAKTKIELDIMTGALLGGGRDEKGNVVPGALAQGYVGSLADRDINQNALISRRGQMVRGEDTEIKKTVFAEQQRIAEIKGLEDTARDLAAILATVGKNPNFEPLPVYANLPQCAKDKIDDVSKIENDSDKMREAIIRAVQVSLAEKQKELVDKKMEYGVGEGKIIIGGPTFEKQLELLNAIKAELAKNPKNPDFSKINATYKDQIPDVFGAGHDTMTKDFSAKIQNQNLMAAVAALEDMKKQKEKEGAKGKPPSLSAAAVAARPDSTNPVIISIKAEKKPATGKITMDFIQKNGVGDRGAALKEIFGKIGIDDKVAQGGLSIDQVNKIKAAIKSSVDQSIMDRAGIDSTDELNKLVDDLHNEAGGLRNALKDFVKTDSI